MSIEVEKLVRYVKRMNLEQLQKLADDLDKRDPKILAEGRIGDEHLPEAFVETLVMARGRSGAPCTFD